MATKDELRFQIGQLRQDKIIYAVESVAVTLAMAMVILVSLIFIPVELGPVTLGGITYPLVPILAAIFAVGYWLYASIGNLRRFTQIKQLERQL